MSAPSGFDFTKTWKRRAGSLVLAERTSTACRVPRYSQVAKPPPASTASVSNTDGIFDFGLSDSGIPAGGVGNAIALAPEAVRDTGGTVRRETPAPLAVEPRDAERWLPVRGDGTPPSGGN